MSDRAGPVGRILASLHEIALVLGFAPLPGAAAACARTTVKLVSNPGRTVRRDRQGSGERR